MRATFGSSDYVYPVRIDWKQIFDDLAEMGLTPFNIGQLTGYTGSTVQRWAHGGEPRKSAADAILLIHENWCGHVQCNIRILEAIPI